MTFCNSRNNISTAQEVTGLEMTCHIFGVFAAVPSALS